MSTQEATTETTNPKSDLLRGMFASAEESGLSPFDLPSIFAHGTTVALAALADMCQKDHTPVVVGFDTKSGSIILSDDSLEDPQVVTALIAELQKKLDSLAPTEAVADVAVH